MHLACTIYFARIRKKKPTNNNGKTFVILSVLYSKLTFTSFRIIQKWFPKFATLTLLLSDLFVQSKLLASHATIAGL